MVGEKYAGNDSYDSAIESIMETMLNNNYITEPQYIKMKQKIF